MTYPRLLEVKDAPISHRVTGQYCPTCCKPALYLTRCDGEWVVYCLNCSRETNLSFESIRVCIDQINAKYRSRPKGGNNGGNQ